MSYKILRELVEAYSPSGCEDSVQKVLYKNYKTSDNHFVVDNRGAMTAIYNENNDYKVMLIAHADEISLVVNGYNEDGTLKVDSNGGIRTKLYVGQRVVIISNDKKYYGVMGYNSDMLKKEKLEVSDLFVDLGFKDSLEAKSNIELGSFVIHNENYLELQNNMICARAFDDRLGDYIIHEAAKKAYKDTNAQILVTTSTGEETTGRGAYSSAMMMKPDLCIVVDVTFSGDYPNANIENDVALGKGGVICRGSVINRKLNEMLVETAKELNEPLQYEVWQGRTGTDGDTILKTNIDTPIVLFSIPLRYMHSPVEVASKYDIVSMIKVLSSFLKKINKNIGLAPYKLEE